MAVPQKIVLKNTTRMSLNERFTTVQRTVPAASVQQVRATFQAQTQASAKNQRLAQQMANRLSLGVNAPPPPQTKPRSLKQRLGTNVKARLNLNQQGFVRGGNLRGRTRGRLTFRGRGRGGLVPRSSTTSIVSSVSDGALWTSSSASRGRGVFRGVRGRFQRGRALGSTTGRGRKASRGRGGIVRGSYSVNYRGGRGGIVASQGVRGKRGVGRGRGAGRGRGIGRGRGRGNAVVVSREQLDEDLDSYMSQGDF